MAITYEQLDRFVKANGDVTMSPVKYLPNGNEDKQGTIETATQFVWKEKPYTRGEFERLLEPYR